MAKHRLCRILVLWLSAQATIEPAPLYISTDPSTQSVFPNMNQRNQFTNLIVERKRARLIVSVIVGAVLMPAQMAIAGPCEDAQYYEMMWHQTDAQAAAEAATDPFGALRWVPTIARWRALMLEAQRDCELLGKVHGPRTQHFGSRGFGPERTGLDWQPFIADLHPKMANSQIQQGDNCAKKGDWQGALRLYDLAARISPASLRAAEKADQARTMIRRAVPPSAEPEVAQPPAAPPPIAPTGAAPSTPPPTENRPVEKLPGRLRIPDTEPLGGGPAEQAPARPIPTSADEPPLGEK
jgi:hypothetical protein